MHLKSNFVGVNFVMFVMRISFVPLLLLMDAVLWVSSSFTEDFVSASMLNSFLFSVCSTPCDGIYNHSVD